MVRKCTRCETRESVYKQSDGRQRCAKCGTEVKPPRQKKEREALPQPRFKRLPSTVDRKCGAKPGDMKGVARKGLCANGSECGNTASYHDTERNLLVCGVHKKVKVNA